MKASQDPPPGSVPIFQDIRAKPRPWAALIHGEPKVGKTRFAGTAPKPVFVVPEHDRGTNSLIALNKEIKYTTVTSTKEMLLASRYISQNAKKQGWETVVCDPFTIYGRIALQEIEANFEGRDRRQMFGAVHRHLVDLWNLLQGAGLNMIWVCHSRDVGRDDEEEMGKKVLSREPALIGTALQDIMATVDFILYMDTVEKGEGKEKKVISRVWTRCPEASPIKFRATCRFRENLKPCYVADWAVITKDLGGYVINTDKQ